MPPHHSSQKRNNGGSRAILFDVFENFNRPLIGCNYILGGYKPWPKVSRKYYLLTVERMKKRGWVEEVKKAQQGGQRFLKLTKKGKVQALLYKLQEIKKPAVKSWDGKWRLAIFDIPEQGKLERDRIRWIFKRVGFYCLQKSVYVYPYELSADVVMYLKESGLNRFIRFLRVDRMDDEGDLKRKFEL